FLLIVLMFIGACPGGTGGGIKTTTASVLMATVIAALTGRRRVVIFERTIPLETVFKAVAVATLGMGIVIITTLILSIVESLPLLNLLFEATSAFGTVGLSTGITPNLHTISKLALIATMLIGRIGPLTASLALLGEHRREYIRYPHEDVMIG
ncbi:MAG TPA: TrkH family potassium uptake protein, partial [Armatimonadetes bacterium]|nr:TrkH family potassium uptake protein [Armatimonadota bacterium]